ncbi:MAG: hypothetical protein WCT40_00780 [Candidatus Magasanikbacteria bacterium]
MPNTLKKIVYCFAVTVFLSVSVFGSLAVPASVRAQVPGAPTTVVSPGPTIDNFQNLPLINEVLQALRAKYFAKEVEMKWYEVMLLAAYMGITQAIQSFITRVAYDSAVYLAAGGKGETPFSHYNNFGDYMASVGNDAAGFFLQGLGEILGVDLCAPPTLFLDLALRLGLKGKYFPEKPKCTFTQFLSNWKQVGSSRYWKNMAQNFNFSIKPDQSDLGIYLDASAKVDRTVKENTYGAEKQRDEGQGAIGMSDIISGNVKTPAQVMQKEFQNQSASEKAKTNTQVINSSMASGMKDLLIYTPAVFFNTFFSQVLNNFMYNGMLFGFCVSDVCKKQEFDWPEMPELGLDEIGNDDGSWEPKPEDDDGGPDPKDPDATTASGRQVAEAMFIDLLKSPINSIDEWNLVNLFGACPANPTPDNCIIDYALASALNEPNSTGRYLTITQAMQRDLLHKKFKLIPPTNSEDTSPQCYQKYYCYSNVKKMRQARILPLGFEIAARNSNPDAPWTLEDVVNGFYDCTYDAQGHVVHDAKKPFCHLINPNWVIKVPPHRCNALVFGSDIEVPGSGNRSKECADLQGCVGYSLDGKSCQSYGYCLKEKNVWKFNADNCEEQYASCVSFKDVSGKQVGYLYRTLDTGKCNADNAGCAIYSLTKDDAGNWLTASAPTPSNNFQNTAIHFNGKVSTDCTGNSSGCTAYTATLDDASLYLRRAPDYLGCYNARPESVATVWPDSLSDLNGINTNLLPWKKTECAKYAQPCIAAEENCNMYTASASGEQIPGKFNPAEIANGLVLNWNDQCDAKCVGYASYREMPSNYSRGQNLAYIIPKSGNTCSAVEEGCSAFTNMSALVGQMEKIDYYAYLRPCITPDQATSGKFFTYESTQAEGVQLKSYVLKIDKSGEADADAIKDGPAYFYRTQADLDYFKLVCNATVYAQGSKSVDWDDAVSPDCRQFTDDKGHTYYRILSQTVPVSQTCTPYRLNTAELQALPAKSETDGLDATECSAKKGYWNTDHCELCFNNGEYKDGFCYYNGLPAGENNTAGVSRVCSAAVETCRAYKGNAGNNVRNIFYDQFENTSTTEALAGWVTNNGSISLVSESTKTGEHSLSFYASAGSAVVAKNLKLNPEKGYDLTFWAKGTGANGGTQKVSISLANNANTALGDVEIGDSWRHYHLGPVELAGATSTAQLKFTLNNSGRIYIDNIKLMEVVDYIYLVKKSLSVNTLCDSNPLDNLPGEALGCARYQTPNNNPFYLTNFSYLCREDAVGCTAVIDTQNTQSDTGEGYYNVWLPGPRDAGKLTVTVGGTEYSCIAETGAYGCYTNISHQSYADIVATTAQITSSTIHIPADTPSTTPIYLVADKKSACTAANVGCMDAGKQTDTPSGPKFTATRVKNLPDGYFGSNNSAGTLCTNEAVGCNKYGSSKGDLYFKDPKVIGQKICSWQTRVEKAPYGITYGWFWKGVGRCDQSSEQSPAYCKVDSDCSGAEGTKCIDTDKQACYPDYLVDYQKYDLWSYGTNNKYNGFVGECPLSQNSCTEFTDKNDCQPGKPCQSYYLLMNEKIKPSLGACNGMASLNLGCVLLDQTDIVNKYWNTGLTYRDSNRQNGEKVAPIASGTLDANIIVQALPDRACAEWDYCRLANYRFNPITNKQEQECYMLGVCDKFLPSSGDNKCAHDVTETRADKDKVIVDRALSVRAGMVNYLDRDITWGGPDYTGFSMFTDRSDQPHFSPSDVEVVTSSFTCRGYPEANSPFPLSVFKNSLSSSDGSWPGFDNVKLCEDKSNGGKDCDCGYYKLGYGAEGSSPSNQKIVYWPQVPTNELDSSGAPKGYWSVTGEPWNCAANDASNVGKTYYRFSSSSFGIATTGLKYLAFPRNLYAKDGDSVSLKNYSSPPTCVYSCLVAGDRTDKVYYHDCEGSVSISDGVSEKMQIGDSSLIFRCTNSGLGIQQTVEVYENPTLAGTCLPRQSTQEIPGWKGYCLEHDLRRPLNGTAMSNAPDYACLSWLPVNSPAGVNNRATANESGTWYNNSNIGDTFDGDNSRFKCIESSINTITNLQLGDPFYTALVDIVDGNIWKNDCIGQGLDENIGVVFPQSSSIVPDAQLACIHNSEPQSTNVIFRRTESKFNTVLGSGTVDPGSGKLQVLNNFTWDKTKYRLIKAEVYLTRAINLNSDPVWTLENINGMWEHGNYPIAPGVVVFDFDKISSDHNLYSGIKDHTVSTLSNTRQNVEIKSKFEQLTETLDGSSSPPIPVYQWRAIRVDNTYNAVGTDAILTNDQVISRLQKNIGETTQPDRSTIIDDHEGLNAIKYILLHQTFSQPQMSKYKTCMTTGVESSGSFCEENINAESSADNGIFQIYDVLPYSSVQIKVSETNIESTNNKALVFQIANGGFYHKEDAGLGAGITKSGSRFRRMSYTCSIETGFPNQTSYVNVDLCKGFDVPPDCDQGNIPPFIPARESYCGSLDNEMKLGYVVVGYFEDITLGYCRSIAQVKAGKNNFLLSTWRARQPYDYRSISDTVIQKKFIIPWSVFVPDKPYGLMKDVFEIGYLRSTGRPYDFTFNNYYRGDVGDTIPLGWFDINSSTIRDQVSLGVSYDSSFSEFGDSGIPLLINRDYEASNFVKTECSGFNVNSSPSIDSIYCLWVERLFRRIYGIYELNSHIVNYTERPGISETVVDYPLKSNSYFDTAAPGATRFTRFPPIVAAPDLDRSHYGDEEQGIYQDCSEDQGRNCKISALDRFSVNNQIRGDILVKAGAEVKIRYYSWAHPNQMPITSMEVDFADTFKDVDQATLPSIGPLANRKPRCFASNATKYFCTNYPEVPCASAKDCAIGESTGQCHAYLSNVPSDVETYFGGFGSSNDTGCEAGYTEVGYIYECPMPSTTWDNIPQHKKFPQGPYALMKVGANPLKPDEIEISETHIGSFLKTGDIVCAYRPRIQLVDNWGWCTGGCYASTAAGDAKNARGIQRGCYNFPDNPNTIARESDGTQYCSKYQNSLNLNFPDAGNYSYIPYDGHIIVLPSEMN